MNMLRAMKNAWKLLILVLLVLITFSYAMFQGGFVSWFLFYSFLPFALYGVALSLYSMKGFEADRVFLKSDYNAGEKLRVTIDITRNSSFPLFYLVVEDLLSEQLTFSRQSKKAKTLVFPYFRREFSFDYEIEDLPRGEHLFEKVRIKLGDPLGLIEKEIHINTEDRIVVYPKYVELNYRAIANHYDQGMTASKERVQRDSSMAIGIREYQPGDKYSWINWKATAKRNDIMTKEFEQRQSHDIMMLMDCSPDNRFEVVVSFTASMLKAILRKGAQVGLLSVSSERAVFPIRGGEGQQQSLFYHLAKVKDNSRVPVEKVIEKESMLTQQNVTLMIVTAQLTKGLIEKAGFFVQRKGSAIVFLVKGKNETVSNNEVSLKAAANARGVRVVLIHDTQFNEAFQEVNRA